VPREILQVEHALRDPPEEARHPVLEHRAARAQEPGFREQHAAERQQILLVPAGAVEHQQRHSTLRSGGLRRQVAVRESQRELEPRGVGGPLDLAGIGARHAQRRQRRFDRAACALVLGRQHQAPAETGCRLVDREARAVGGELEQHPARLAEVDGAKVGAIDHRGRPAAGSDHRLAHRELGSLVRDPPRHVVHGACPLCAAREAGHRAHVEVPGRRNRSRLGDRDEAPSGLFLARKAHAECVHQQALALFVTVHPHRDRVDAAQRLLGRHAGRRPAGMLGGLPGRGGRAHDLEHQPVRVAEGDHALTLAAGNAALGRAFEGDRVAHQALEPEAGRRRGGGERRHRRLPRAGAAAPRPGPGKEREQAPGRSVLVAEIEMIGLRIVEVDGALDQPEAQDAGVEIEVALRIAGDRGDVVDAQHPRHVVRRPSTRNTTMCPNNAACTRNVGSHT
jgi:hypothetical protein